MTTEYIDKLAYIEIKNRKVLVTLSKGKDTWYIPGGKREPGESDIQALKREVFEELSVTLKDSTISLYGVFEAQAHGKPEGTKVRMTCYMGEYEGNLSVNSEIDKLDYFVYDQRQNNSPVDQLIFQDLKDRNLID